MENLVEYAAEVFRLKVQAVRGAAVTLPQAPAAVVAQWGMKFVEALLNILNVLVKAFTTPSAFHLFNQCALLN